MLSILRFSMLYWQYNPARLSVCSQEARAQARGLDCRSKVEGTLL